MSPVTGKLPTLMWRDEIAERPFQLCLTIFNSGVTGSGRRAWLVCEIRVLPPHFVMGTDLGPIAGRCGCCGRCPASCCQGEGLWWASGWPGRAGQPGVWRVSHSSWPRSLVGVLEPGEVSHGLDRGHAKAGGRDRVAAVADDREQQRVTPAGRAGDGPDGQARPMARQCRCGWPSASTAKIQASSRAPFPVTGISARHGGSLLPARAFLSGRERGRVLPSKSARRYFRT
jgi:hypothetical protein